MGSRDPREHVFAGGEDALHRAADRAKERFRSFFARRILPIVGSLASATVLVVTALLARPGVGWPTAILGPSPSPSPTTLVDRLTVLADKPLALPTISPSTSCPITKGQYVKTHDTGNVFVLGPGPAYLLFPGNRPPGIYHIGADPQGGWFTVDSFWLLSPQAQPPFLERVARLDGPGAIGIWGEGFDDDVGDDIGTDSYGRSISTALIHGKTSNVDAVDGWAEWPGETYLQGPGCYAFGIDGANFSYTIVFRIVP